MSGWKLYEIDSFLRQTLDEMESHIDETTGELPADWGKFVDEVQGERDKKCLGIAAYIREQTAYADAVKAEADRLTARARAATNRATWLKGYLASVVNVGEKLKDASVQISWRKSSAVVIDDESKLPENCFRIIREVSKTIVKDNYLEGGLPDGACHIEERQSIQIR